MNAAEESSPDLLEQLGRRLDAETRTRERLVQVAVQLTSTLDPRELLHLIMTSAAELLEAETSSLLLLDEDTGELVIEVATGEPGERVERQRVPAGAGIAGWALANRRVAVVDDPATDERFFTDISEAAGYPTRNLLASPLTVRDRAIGVLEVLNKRTGDGFDARDVELAGGFAGLAAVALDNARLYARLSEAVLTARLSYRL